MIFLGESIPYEYPVSEKTVPKICAEQFVEIMKKKGYKLNFSIESLENGIDDILEKYSNIEGNDLSILIAFLTAYIGETLIRIFGGGWDGDFYGPLSRTGINFYTSYIVINDFRFNPNHFISYYLGNGKKSEGTFYNYLYHRDKSKGLHSDFLGGGLINNINNNIQ